MLSIVCELYFNKTVGNEWNIDNIKKILFLAKKKTV